MAGKCGCSGDSCSCVINGSGTVSVTGNGTPDNPYVLTSAGGGGGTVLSVGGIGPDGTGDVDFPAIRYDIPQSLTSGQMTQARTNIGAPPVSGSDLDAVHYIPDTGLTTARINQALLNIKAMPVLRPEQYGAVGNGTTDDSIAFYNCKAAGLAQAVGGFVMQLKQGTKYYLGQAAHTAHSLNGLFDLDTGVYIVVPGGSGRATAGATQIIGDHTFNGYIIDTPMTGIRGCGISGVHVLSNMSSPGSNANGGVRFSAVTWGHVINCGIDNVTDIALNILGCVDMHLENLAISHSITARTLTDVTPAFFLSGTDHVCINIQANGGNTNPTIGTGLTSTSFRNPAIQLYACDTSKFFSVNGEFADVGWFLGGTSSASGGALSLHVSLNQFVDVRGDYNAAHGFYLAGAAWNQFHSTTVYNNSNNSNGLYDGIYSTASAAVVGNRYVQIMGGSPVGNTHIMGYYYHDAATGGVNQMDANIVTSIGGMRQGMCYDFALSQTPYRFSYISGQGGGNYAFRMASRYMSGGTWSDLATPTAPVLTYSDGGGAVTGSGGSIIGNGGWRIVGTNALTGNLLNAITSECLGGVSTGWLGITTALCTSGAPVTAATATWAPTAFNLLPTIVQKLGGTQILAVTCNAAGVTAGAMQVLTPAVVSGIAASTAYAAAVTTIAGSTLRNVKFIVDCFNGATFLSSITTDAGANNATGAVATHAFSFTTPASTNAIQVRVVFTGTALGEVHYVGLMSVDTHSTQTIPVYS